MVKPKRRIIGWDIEATHLRANFGHVLCIGWKVFGQKTVHVPSIQDYNGSCKSCKTLKEPINDKALLEAVYDDLASADAWVTWFGKGFDVKFVNSRLIFHGLPPLPPIPHIDGWRTAKSKLCLTSNRLATVQDFLQLPTSKTSVDGHQWNLASSGDPAALRYIFDHCRKDVNVLEEAYDKMLPLIVDSPNMGLVEKMEDGCPRCGLGVLKTNPSWIYSSATRKYQRYQCIACGGWCKRNKALDRSPFLAM